MPGTETITASAITVSTTTTPRRRATSTSAPIVYRRSSRSSRAARWPDSTAPFMYPCQRSLVCSPANTTRPALIGFDELAAEFRVLAGRKVADRPDASAGMVARVEQRDGRTGAGQVVSRGQTRKPRSRNYDTHAAHEPSPEQPRCHVYSGAMGTMGAKGAKGAAVRLCCLQRLLPRAAETTWDIRISRS